MAKVSKRKGRALRAVLYVFASLLLAGGLCYGLLHHAVCGARYRPTENSFLSSSFFQNKEVMVLVPHQDDGLNIASAMIENYRNAGSHVTLVFSTNGDYENKAEIRVSEALKVAKLLDISSEDIVLLGYGDTCTEPYLYNAENDTVVQSHIGRTETYGAAGLTDFRTRISGLPSPYTKRAFHDDVYDLLDLYRPDVLICVDLDRHDNHRMLSLTADRCIGELLRNEPDYRPLVLKGLAYDTAWKTVNDVYALPLRQSVAPDYYEFTDVSAPYFRWAERVRMPVPQDFRAYTLHASKLRSLLSAYASQGGAKKQALLQNSDQVYWERRVDGLSYTASLEATSGDPGVLTDFLRGDMNDVMNDDAICDAGQWIPDEDDWEPSVTFSWSEPQTIGSIVLFDSADPYDGVSEVSLRFDDQEEIVIDDIDASGMPTTLTLEKPITASSMTLSILSTEIGMTGLCEVEIYPPANRPALLLKLVTADDDFAYERSSQENQSFSMGLYTWPADGNLPELRAGVYTQNGKKVADVTIDRKTIHVPALDRGCYRLYVESMDGTLYDECWINVGDDESGKRLLQRLDMLLP